ncbi:MAG: hypothetical protein M3Z16_11540 [Pseudomonadota bacterium]|nr:hypothetical protein [Pseudomonadota bacterium]
MSHSPEFTPRASPPPSPDEPPEADFLVVFDHRPVDGDAPAAAAPAEMSEHDRALEREVEDLRWHLRDLTERRDLAIEELKAGNEELQR